MTIKIASAQYPITRHDSLDNWKAHVSTWVANAAEKDASVILFPEYGSMELVSLLPEEVQQDINRQIADMQVFLPEFKATFTALAAEYNSIIVAPSFPEKVEDRYYNRSYVFGPDGLAGYQDKLFMTRFEDEEWGIHAAPKELTVFATEWGKFGIQICYDSEFSISSQTLAENGVDLLLVPSCTDTIRGASRVHIGTRARAMEQQMYAVVSPTVGEALWSPAVDINYGFAGVYATPDNDLPEEGIVSRGEPQQEDWHIAELDFSLIRQVRADGQVFNFKDHRDLDFSFVGNPINVKTVTI